MNVRASSIAYAGAFLVLGLLALKVLKEGKALGEGAARTAGKVLEAVNPANPNNIAAAAVNGLVQTVTGEKDVTLGGKLAEWFNPAVRAADRAIAAAVAPIAPSRLRGDLLKDYTDAELRAGAPFDWRDALAETHQVPMTDFFHGAP